MCKISVLFKPSRWSKINSDLTYLWYFEYSYKWFYEIDKQILKNSKKIKIEWVLYEDIWNLYEYCNKIFKDDTVVIIMCSISNLFDN